MLGNVFKMIVVHLLLFSVLLYNTGAVFDDEYYKTTTLRSTAIEAAIPVEDTTTTNGTETIGWSYESGAVEKNETRDNKIVLFDYKTPAPVTETTDRWSYGSGAVEKNETLDYETVPVENPAAVSDKEPANITFEFAVTKPYEDDVGYLTVDNGTLTSDLPKKNNEKKRKSKHVGSHKQHYSFWYKEPEKYRTTTESSYYYWFNKKVKDSETTTTRRPYYSYWYKETDGDKNETAAPYYGYNKTFVESETTTTIRPYYWYLNNIIGNNKNTTESSYYRYNPTVKDSETTTTRKPYYSYWYKETDGNKNKTAAPYYGYNKTVVESETTTAIRPYYWYLNNMIGDHKHTTSSYRYDHIRVEPPIFNRANSSNQNVTTDQVDPETPPSRRNPVNISINSSINANEARNYGAFTDLFKKISAYILPSNIAPNSSVTNLAAVNGNGNLFFFM